MPERRIRDLFFRSPQEKTAEANVNRLLKQAGRNNGVLKQRDERELDRHQLLLKRMGRRRLIARSAATIAGGVAAFGGYQFLKSLDGEDNHGEIESGFDGWSPEEEFDSEAIRKMGVVIEGRSDLPGFPESGRLMQQSVLNLPALKDYVGAEVDSVRSGLLALDKNSLARTIVDLNDEDATVEYTDKATGQKLSGNFKVPVGSQAFIIVLENSAQFAPQAAKELLLVKEFSHFIYIRDFKKEITRQVRSRYDFPDLSDSELGGLLYVSGQRAEQDKKSGIPSLGYLFDNAGAVIDGAGYWHIMQAYGKMKRSGMLTQYDINVLSTDGVFNQAVNEGLLKEESKGVYKWKEGIGPFSPEWTSIIVPFLKS